METVNVDLLLVIGVISAITQSIKKLSITKLHHLASFLAIILSIIYVSVGKYFFAMFETLNWLNTIILGLAIGFAATGGYENIKNLLNMAQPKSIVVTNTAINTDKANV